MLLLALIASLIGFAALALALGRHHRQVWRREPSARRRWLLRAVGTACLLAGLLLCAAQVGWAQGLIWWAGLLSIAALLVSLLLSFRPNWLAHMPRSACLGGHRGV
jgi:hypothetical protein